MSSEPPIKIAAHKRKYDRDSDEGIECSKPFAGSVQPEIEEIYRGLDGSDDTTSWHDMQPLFQYNGPKIVIPKVPRELNSQEQWHFVFTHFKKSTRFIVPKDFDIDKAKKEFNIGQKSSDS